MEDANFWLPADFLNHTTTSGYGSNFNSDLSSPVDSASEEEDYLDDLSRKLAHSTLFDDGFWITKPPSKATRVMAGCGCNKVLTWDLPQPPPNPNLQFHRLQAAKLQQLKQQQMMKQQQQQQFQFLQQRRRVAARNGGGWQQSQPAIGSGMRAVFLGKPNSKRESSGTGVFLPRLPTETETDTPRKKRGYSTTVLIPDRVVQALNLNLLQSQPPQPLHHYEMGYQKSVLMDKDLRLPQEWTY